MTFDPEYKEPVKIVNDNQQSPRVTNRADDTQNDGTSIKITLYTIDNAILKYMGERIKPIVTQNGAQVKVPVIYGDPERWKSAQRDGVMRDSIGKIQLPMIMVRRNSMKKTSINSAVNKYYDRTFYSGWNRRTPYDQFSVINGITPSREYYNTTATPDYYEITYRCMVWTEYMEQMNQIVENISFESDEFWGERNSYKFRTMIDSFETLTELPNNSDRVVRTQFDMKVHAYLLPESQLDAGGNRGLVTKKRYGTKRVVTFLELEDDVGTTVGPSTPADTLLTRTILVTANKSSMNEGDSVTFTITTTGLVNGYRLYWENVGSSKASDFSQNVNMGEVELINNSATVTFSTSSDLSLEGSETLVLFVEDRFGATATSPTVTINDTSVPTTTTTTVPGIVPEYWWRADSGLTTSSWEASAGGLDLTLYNVTTASSATGAVFDGASFGGYGETTELSTGIDAKHIFMYFTDLNTASFGKLLASDINGYSTAYGTGGSGSANYWFVWEAVEGGLLPYSTKTGLNLTLNNNVWLDFTTSASAPIYYHDGANTGTLMVPNTPYGGTFTNRFRFPSGSPILVARGAQFNSEIPVNMKEIAIFTTPLTTEQGKEFRQGMISRWE